MNGLPDRSPGTAPPTPTPTPTPTRKHVQPNATALSRGIAGLSPAAVVSVAAYESGRLNGTAPVASRRGSRVAVARGCVPAAQGVAS